MQGKKVLFLLVLLSIWCVLYGCAAKEPRESALLGPRYTYLTKYKGDEVNVWANSTGVAVGQWYKYEEFDAKTLKAKPSSTELQKPLYGIEKRFGTPCHIEFSLKTGDGTVFCSDVLEVPFSIGASPDEYYGYDNKMLSADFTADYIYLAGLFGKKVKLVRFDHEGKGAEVLKEFDIIRWGKSGGVTMAILSLFTQIEEPKDDEVAASVVCANGKVYFGIFKKGWTGKMWSVLYVFDGDSREPLYKKYPTKLERYGGFVDMVACGNYMILSKEKQILDLDTLKLSSLPNAQYFLAANNTHLFYRDDRSHIYSIEADAIYPRKAQLDPLPQE